MTEGRTQVKSCTLDGSLIRFPASELTLISNNCGDVELLSDSTVLVNTFVSNNVFTNAEFIAPVLLQRQGVIFTNNYITDTFTCNGGVIFCTFNGNIFKGNVVFFDISNSIFSNNNCDLTSNFNDIDGTDIVSNRFNDPVTINSLFGLSFSGNRCGTVTVGSISVSSISTNVWGTFSTTGSTLSLTITGNMGANLIVGGTAAAITQTVISGNRMIATLVSTAGSSDSTNSVTGNMSPSFAFWSSADLAVSASYPLPAGFNKLF